ncbi:kinase-like domain-containing protein, partial [Elsinoe ampelina]
MYGFAEAGLLTPHYTVKRLWWTAERIDDTVNRRFVVGHIRGHERQFLDRKIIYHTLTNDTYLDWILFKAPRLFLTLVEIRCAERIFSLVDDGWDDSDLPVPWKDIERLDLNIDPDHILNRRFYEAQYTYLLRQLEEDYHVEYGPNEYIPMEYVGTIPPAVDIKDWHRIHFPDEWRSQFVRRQFNFGDNEDERRVAEIEYLEDVKVMKKHQHYHLCDVWASYTNENSGFTLSTYIGEHTLKTFMDHRTPPQYMELNPDDRPCLLLEWMHCLADVVAYLHKCDTYHGAIRPSNILVDSVNCVAFSDIGHLKTFKKDKRVSKQELRDYTAPELLQESSPKTSIYNPFAQHETNSTWKIPPPALRHPPSTHHPSADVFSLGCIYLDILTFLVLGKTTTLQKFRRSKSTTIPSHTSYTPSLIRSGASTPVTQSSPGVFSSASSTHFHSDPVKLHAWTSHLLSISSQQVTPLHSSLVELLPLVKQMLAPNPSLRPSMQEVRGVVEETLSRQGETRRLCCRGRRW